MYQVILPGNPANLCSSKIAIVSSELLPLVCGPDPLENCHWNVKKMPKTTFKKKTIAKNCYF